MGRWVMTIALFQVLCATVFGQQPNSVRAQPLSQELSGAVRISDGYIAEPNITYVTVQNYQAKLDLYRPANATALFLW
jgi:hypothetical protein